MALPDRRYRESERSWDQLQRSICSEDRDHAGQRRTTVKQGDCFACFEKEMIRRDLCLRFHDTALICSICGMGREPVKGPEKITAWWHKLVTGRLVWCPASNIHERIRREMGDWYGAIENDDGT